MAQGLRRALDSFPSPTHTLTEGGHTDGEAADYIICEVCPLSRLETLWHSADCSADFVPGQQYEAAQWVRRSRMRCATSAASAGCCGTWARCSTLQPRRTSGWGSHAMRRRLSVPKS
jgi:hypothetical protein